MCFVAHPPLRCGSASASLQHALRTAAARPVRSAPAALSLSPSANNPQPLIPKTPQPQPHHRPPPCAWPTRRLACQDCPRQLADSPTSSLGSPSTGLQKVVLRPHRQEGGCASLPVFFAALNRG